MMDSLNRWVEILRDKIPLRLDFQPNENETVENTGDRANVQGPSVSRQSSAVPESQVASSGKSDEDESEFSAEKIWDLSELDPDLAENVFKPTITESRSAGDSDDGDDSEMTSESGASVTVIGSQSVSSAEDTEDTEDDVTAKPNIQRVTVTEEQSDEDDEYEGTEPVVAATTVEKATVETATVEESAEEDEEYQLSLEDDNSDGENDELFSGSVKVRPQVRKLLDTHGTIEAKDLLVELKSVANILEKS